MLRPIAAIGHSPYQLLTAPLLMNSLISLFVPGASALADRQRHRRAHRHPQVSAWWSASTLFVSTLAAALVGRFFPVLGAIPLPIDGHPLFPLLLLAFAHYYGTTQARMWGLGEPVSGRGLAYFFIGIGLVLACCRGSGCPWRRRSRHWAGRSCCCGAPGQVCSYGKRKLKVVDGGQPWRAKPDEAKWLN